MDLVYYEVHRPGHLREKQIYHVHLLREWHDPEWWVTFTEDDPEDLSPQGMTQEVPKSKAEHFVWIGEELLAL